MPWLTSAKLFITESQSIGRPYRRFGRNRSLQEVAELLASTELVYDDVALAAQALNAECRTAMTPEFLSTASDDNPIELTSFIVNPNVFQTVSEMAPPSGWDCDKGAADGTWYTSTEVQVIQIFSVTVGPVPV